MNVLVDDVIYVSTTSGARAMPFSEGHTALLKETRRVNAVFIGCESKCMRDTGQDAGGKAQKAFPSDYIAQEEHLPGGLVQIVAAPKESIRDIYERLRPIIIDQAIPYPAAVRAILRQNGLLSGQNPVVVVDDMKTHVVITIFEGLTFTSPRRIPIKDIHTVTEEVNRSQKHYHSPLKGGGHSPVFDVVSNHMEWLDALKHNDSTHNTAFHFIESTCPALDGMDVAQFQMNFCLPEDLSRRRMKERKVKFVRNFLMVLMLIISGAGAYIFAFIKQQARSEHMDHLRSEEVKVQGKLAVLYQERFHSWLKQYPIRQYDRLYFDLIRGIPYGYSIKEYMLEEKDLSLAHIAAIIAPVGNHIPLAEFSRQGELAKADVKDIVVDKVVGQSIELNQRSEPAFNSVEPVNNNKNAVEERIQKMNKDIQTLSSLDKDPAADVSHNYAGVYDMVRVLGQSFNLKRTLDTSVEATASPWAGIRQQSMTVHFYDLVGIDEYMRILRFIIDIRRHYPIKVKKINQTGSNLEIGIDIYGK